MILNRCDDYRLPQLTRVDDPAGRFYTHPDLPNKKFYSMTTMLSATADKSHLEEWRRRIGDAEANKITHVSSSRGTELHKRIEDEILGVPVNELRVNPIVKMLFSGVKKKVLPRISEVRGIESQMFSKKLEIAGTTDLICVIDNTLSVLDWKNSRSDKSNTKIDDYFIQGAGYAHMWYELTGEVIKDIKVVIASDETLYPVERDAKVKDWVNKLYERVEAFHSIKTQ